MDDLSECERFLHERLRELRLAYEREAKPLIDALVRINNMRPPSPIMVTIEQAEQLGLLAATTDRRLNDDF